jgi:hypothetical protein
MGSGTEVNREELREILFKERGHACEECGKGNAVQINHWMYHDRKLFHNVLTVPDNCGMVCVTCHAEGACHTKASKIRFAQRQLARGYKLDAFRDSLPTKIKWEKYW